MDFRQLKYFAVIADKGSLSAAAEALGVAQPSLSQHIIRLEEELAAQLFVRSSRGVTLTDSGTLLYARAQTILNAVESAVAELREHASELRGPVSFAFPSSVSNILTVPLSETIGHDYPKVSLRAIDAMSGYVQSWLAEGSIDFGILYDVNSLRHLQVQPLLVENLYLVAAPDNWKGEIGPNGVAKEPVTLAQAAALRQILPHKSHGLREMIERFTQAHNIVLTVDLEMDSLSQIRSLVARGSGYSILSPAAVWDEVRRGELVLVPIKNPVMRRTVYLVKNPTRPLTRAAREVERIACKIVRELVKRDQWMGQLTAHD